jgi:hypothetical protein
MGLHQVRDDAPPLARELARAVQEHDRRSGTAFQHGGGHARQLQSTFGDGKSR